MKSPLRLFVVILMCIDSYVYAQNDIGFENNNLGAWIPKLGGAALTPNLNSKNSGFYITSDTEKIAPYINQPAVCPDGGLYSLMLGTFNRGSYTSNLYSIENTIDIDSNVFAIPFWYSMYYEIHDGYYRISLSDDDSIYYEEFAELNLLHRNYSFIVNGNLYNRFLKWTFREIKINNLKGKSLKFKIEVKGCSEGGHTSIMWVDFSCMPLNTKVRQYQCNNDLHLFLNPKVSSKLLEENKAIVYTSEDTIIQLKVNQNASYQLLSYKKGFCSEKTIIVTSDSLRDVQFGGNSFICLYDSFRFDNLSKGFAQFKWDFGDGDWMLTSHNNAIKHKYKNQGTYQIKLYGNDSFCSDTFSLSVSALNAKHLVKFFDTKICVGDSVMIVPSPKLKGSSYSWLYNSRTRVLDSLIFKPEREGIYPITLYSIDSNGCRDTFKSSINAYNKPKSEFYYDIIGKNMYAFYPLDTVLTHQYKWWFDQDSSSEKLLQISIEDTGKYPVKLRVTNLYGCFSDSTQYIINNKVYLFIPNAFNPSHSTFKPYTNRLYNYQLIVFNKWGEILFESEDPEIGWDGKYKGEMVQQDVYFFVLKGKGIDNQNYRETGTITLLR